jgi:glutathione S-transferase
MLKILGRASSINVRKVLWTCAELERPFEREDWGIGFRPTADAAFRAVNPNALVPVIVDEGDFVLWESNTICRYLAQQAARIDLLPATARDRARVEQWMDWQSTTLNPAWRDAFYALMRNDVSISAAAIAASAAAWARQMAILEDQLTRTAAFVTGDTFTLADVVLGLSVHRWFATPIERPALPATAAYYERLSQRPGFRVHGRDAPA